MTLDDFCLSLESLSLTNTQKALAILWFKDKDHPGIYVKGSQLSTIIKRTGLGNPHPTQLTDLLKRSKMVFSTKSGLQLKPTARPKIYEIVKTVVETKKTKINHQSGFITEDIWKNTRSYIEIITSQINGCYEYGFYDGASVLIRRLVETLLIECFEHLKKENAIRESDGNYMMLAGLIKAAVDNGGLVLGRETKKTLNKIKKVGDNAAHNRRYLTAKNDLDELKIGIRIAIQELLIIANLVKSIT